MFLALNYAKIIKPTQMSGFIIGGDSRSRTDDLLHAMQAL